jgi:hypothetical protein
LSQQWVVKKNIENLSPEVVNKESNKNVEALPDKK